MSGPNESVEPLPAKTYVEKLDGLLNGWEEQHVGLPPSLYDNDAHRFLNMKIDEMRRLTPEQCGEGAFTLRKFAFHLQRSFNREIATVNAINSRIRQTVCKEVGQYKAPSADERRDLAIRNNTHAYELQRLRDTHQARADRLNYLAKTCGDLASSLEEYQKTKRVQRA